MPGRRQSYRAHGLCAHPWSPALLEGQQAEESPHNWDMELLSGPCSLALEVVRRKVSMLL